MTKEQYFNFAENCARKYGKGYHMAPLWSWVPSSEFRMTIYKVDENGRASIRRSKLNSAKSKFTEQEILEQLERVDKMSERGWQEYGFKICKDCGVFYDWGSLHNCDDFAFQKFCADCGAYLQDCVKTAEKDCRKVKRAKAVFF